MPSRPATAEGRVPIEETQLEHALGAPDPAGVGAYVALRAAGRKLAASWAHTHTPLDAVLTAVARARSQVPTERARDIDALEICLARSFRAVDPRRHGGRLSNVYRGVRGLEIRFGGKAFVYAPTDMIARNLSFARALERFADDHGMSPEEATELDVRTFEADQYLVALQPTFKIHPLTRGSRVVDLEEVNEPGVRVFMLGMALWMRQHVDSDGRLTYKYWPSRGEKSSANNVLRQWMGTICLGRLAPVLAERNLEFNLRESYTEDGDLGLIVGEGKVKLGSVALAVLALVESPHRERFRDIETRLRRTIDHLWNPDGSFTTFYEPSGLRDYQNFYPGEALLAWATIYGQEKDAALLERIMASFEYYRDWHQVNPNPAFVPWHTQAYCILWRHTRDPRLAEFVFAMNDWLLGFQQWDDAASEEMRGQFYAPQRREFGPPHASSTGAYLEGLIEAHSLARETGDGARADSYRIAVLRGLRSVMQLQFQDLDMFYIANKDMARGGLRTTTYDNTIRVDNVQHNLMAAMRVLEVFEPQDYSA